MSSLEIGVLVTGVLVFLASLLGVYLFRRFAIVRGHLDVPNERSSHINPTPRGGGIVIAIAALAAYLAASFFFGLPVSIGYVAGAVLIVAISWLDDVYSIAFHSRLIVHIAAAAILIASTGYFSELYIPYAGTTLSLGYLGAILSVIAIVWIVNAYNFMDGIDGIAGVQAVSAAAGWLMIGLYFESESLAFLSAAVLAGSIGFLIHNWPPAKIFMGDAGSAFLGFTFAAMPFIARTRNGHNENLLPWIGMLLLWLFVFDSVVTVIRRMARGEKIWLAHRSHIYQRMVINGFSHRTVTLIYLALSLAVMAAVYGCAIRIFTIENAAIPVAAGSSVLLVTAFIVSRRRAEPR